MTKNKLVESTAAHTSTLRSLGGADPREVRAVLEQLAARRGQSKQPIVLRTEPHTLERYSLLRGVPWQVVDLNQYRPDTSRGDGRRIAVRRAVQAVREALEPTEVSIVIFDATEAWFVSSIYHSLRSMIPQGLFVGLQHGVMELTGPESGMWARHVRWHLSRVQHALLGYNVVGAGFGNLRFDAYVCYGQQTSAYVRRLHSNTRIIKSFRSLVPPVVDEVPRTMAADIVFFAQDLKMLGVRDQDAIYERVLSQLALLTRDRGLHVAVKMHPKAQLDPGLVSAFPSIRFVRDAMVCDVLEPGRTVALSFNSTALLEAAFVGCRIVAIRVPGLHNKWYDMFRDAVPLDQFTAGWDRTRVSAVASGVID